MHEPFFSDVEWGKIFNEELNPPYVPLLQSAVSENFKRNALDLYRVNVIKSSAWSSILPCTWEY